MRFVRMGRPTKEYKRFSCNLSNDTLARIHVHAKSTGMTLTNIIEFALHDYLLNHSDTALQRKDGPERNSV